MKLGTVGSLALCLTLACTDSDGPGARAAPAADSGFPDDSGTTKDTGASDAATKGGVFPQELGVDGNRIVDESGNELVLRGLAPIDPVLHAYANDPDYGPWGEAQFQRMSEWGARIVRLGVEPGIWRYFGETDSLAVLDQAIAWAEKHRLYVIIDFHSIGFVPTESYEALAVPPWGELYATSRQELFDFWDLVSRTYRDQPVVAFYELFNEPFREDGPASIEAWSQYKPDVEALVDVIRANDPDAVVIVGGLDHGYDLWPALDAPIARPGVVYATHPYPDKTKWGRSYDDAFGKLSEQHPVLVTEFGFDNTPGAESNEAEYPGPGRYRDDVIAYLESKRIGWVAWCFSPSWTPSLLLDASYAPSESGEFFRDRLLAHL